MSNPSPSLLPPLRRVVTTHDAHGLAVVESDVLLEQEVGSNHRLCTNYVHYVWKSMEAVPGAQSGAIWVTADGIPVNDNNTR